MGNCLRHQSSTQWGGDDWEFLASEKSEKGMKIEEEGEPGGANKLGFTSFSSSATTEVKIKITKKQLEELLGKVDVNELSVQQVLALMKVSDHYEMHHSSWRPALQTIPE